METKIGRDAAPSDGEVRELVQAAGRGDQEAMLRLLALFEADIDRLSRFMRMPREEARQALTLELLELILGKAGGVKAAPLDGSRCAEVKAEYGHEAYLQ